MLPESWICFPRCHHKLSQIFSKSRGFGREILYKGVLQCTQNANTQPVLCNKPLISAVNTFCQSSPSKWVCPKTDYTPYKAHFKADTWRMINPGLAWEMLGVYPIFRSHPMDRCSTRLRAEQKNTTVIAPWSSSRCSLKANCTAFFQLSLAQLSHAPVSPYSLYTCVYIYTHIYIYNCVYIYRHLSTYIVDIHIYLYIFVLYTTIW